MQTRPLPAVVEPRIIERFHTEIVTFGWPAGAASVLAFVGFSGTPEQICAGGAPIAEVSASQHKRDGALTFPRPLQPSGCTVCLVPVAYSRGEQIRGEISALHYPGLDRLSYWFEPVPSNGPAPQRLRLVLNADHDIENPPPLVLVNNEQRLPLEPRDGRYVQLDSPQGPVPHCVLQRIPRGAARTDWTFEIGRMEGYMRLFVYEEVDRSRALALHDPLLQNLTIPRQPQSGQPGAHGPQGGL